MLPRLTGRVFDDRANDRVFNDADVAIAGVSLQLFRDADQINPVALTTTDADGFYSFENLLPGEYRVVEIQPTGFLDGAESAGSLGGTIDNAHDSNTISGVVLLPGDVGIDYDFAEIRPSQAMGLVWSDFNNDGEVDFGEEALEEVLIALTGTDDRGNAVSRNASTDANGIYSFVHLRPSDAAGYTIRELQPTGYTDGKDSLGNVNGVAVGSGAVNDTFSSVVLPRPNSAAENYNFGERPSSDGAVGVGQTAAIGFWQNKKGQSLINSLGGDSTSKKLGNWLAATFPNMYGAAAGANNLGGKSNADVANFYKSLFAGTAKTASGDGPPKLGAQVMATALATYVTNQTLAGTMASAFGFRVTENGLGTRNHNVGTKGVAFGVANHTSVTVLDLLLAVNDRSKAGRLYDLDGDGDASDTLETFYRTMANDLFSEINEAGHI